MNLVPVSLRRLGRHISATIKFPITQGRITRLAGTRTGWHLVAAIILVLCLAPPTFAGGHSPTPPPKGTIFVARADAFQSFTIWGMKGDGSGAVQVLPTTFQGLGEVSAISPSFKVYGSDAMRDRWWIVPEVTGYYDEFYFPNGNVVYNRAHFDLFAIRTNPANRNQLIKIQLTDLYGKALPIDASAWVTSYWANHTTDGPDSSIFLPFAYDLRGCFRVNENGRSVIELTPTFNQTSFRLPISADDVQSGWLNDDFLPIGPARYASGEELDLALDLMKRTKAGTSGFYSESSSPDASLFVRYTSNEGYFITTELVPDLIIQSLGPVGAGRGSPHLAKWSPDGRSIMVVDGTTASRGAVTDGGDIYLHDVEGNGLKLLLKSTSSTKRGTTTAIRYAGTNWSPDSDFLIARAHKFINGIMQNESLVRVSASTGAVVDLKATSPYMNLPIRWVSNDPN